MSTPFPDNIFDVLEQRFKTIVGVNSVVLRSLNELDANGALGMHLDYWQPVEYEIGGFGPSLADYVVQIEHLVKHANRQDGNKVHRSVARNLRTMLYHDEPTVVALRQLIHSEDGINERLMKWSVEQRFGANDINKNFYFLSITTVTFQTSIP